MRKFSMIAMMGVVLAAPAAFAQTPPPAAPSASAATPATPPVQTVGKRDACRADGQSKGLRGQAKRDAMQLCVAQGQLDCVKAAIAQNTAGAQRKDFMKSCMGQKGNSKSPI